MKGAAPIRTRRATDALPPGSVGMATNGGLPTRAWRAAAKRRKERHLAEGPVALPLVMGWPAKRLDTYGWLALGLLCAVPATPEISTRGGHAGWGPWFGLAYALMWTTWIVLSMRHPAIRLTETEIQVRPEVLGKVRTLRRDQVVDVVEIAPGRTSLLVTDRPRYVPLPLKHLTADERHLLARALAHYGVQATFT